MTVEERVCTLRGRARIRIGQQVARRTGTARWHWTHPLASKNRGAALVRLARWQVGLRVLPGPAVVSFAAGTVLPRPARDDRRDRQRLRGPFSRTLRAAQGKTEGSNTLYLRDFADADRRVRTAPAVGVLGVAV